MGTENIVFMTTGPPGTKMREGNCTKREHADIERKREYDPVTDS